MSPEEKDYSVHDNVAERRIFTGNLIGIAILGLVGWIALNLDYIKDGMATFGAEIAANRTHIEHVRDQGVRTENRLEEHIRSDRGHAHREEQ